jgi:hypothetical protein
MLDVMLFGALKKHATGLSTLDEEQPAPHSQSRSLTISNRQWWRSISGALLHLSSSFTHDIKQKPYGLLFDKEKF